MKILYKVWYRDYGNDKKLKFVGSFFDYWKAIDYTRGRKRAVEMFGQSIPDPNAVVVTVGKNPGEKGVKS